MARSMFENARSLQHLYADTDWATTSLGDPSAWSPTLRSSLALALNTHFAVTLMWGEDFTLVYNEAYAEMIAEKHPRALGRPAAEVFPEAWHIIGPMLESVKQTRAPVFQEDTPLMLQRRGILEEAFFTFCYSPVIDDRGNYEGVLDIAAETSSQIINLRRIRTLATIDTVTAGSQTPDDLIAEVVAALSQAGGDLDGIDIGTADDLRDRPDRFWGRAPVARFDGIERDAERPDVVWIQLTRSDIFADTIFMVVRLSEHLLFDDSYRDFLKLIASSLSTALRLAVVREQELLQSRYAASLAEALQRSLLSAPTPPDELRIAARYAPAAHEAKIGGDWYDIFTSRSGITSVVVGDVAGHDQHAAALMGQARNVLRGINFVLDRQPAETLTALDEAMRRLPIDGLCTAVLVTFGNVDDGNVGDGNVPFTWSNAGHPPPLLVDSQGTARLLGAKADLLLGIDSMAERHSHGDVLGVGDTLLLYTDGLVERRGVDLESSLQLLAREAGRLHELPIDKFCDSLMTAMTGESDDDIALIALRLRD